MQQNKNQRTQGSKHTQLTKRQRQLHINDNNRQTEAEEKLINSQSHIKQRLHNSQLNPQAHLSLKQNQVSDNYKKKQQSDINQNKKTDRKPTKLIHKQNQEKKLKKLQQSHMYQKQGQLQMANSNKKIKQNLMNDDNEIVQHLSINKDNLTNQSKVYEEDFQRLSQNQFCSSRQTSRHHDTSAKQQNIEHSLYENQFGDISSSRHTDHRYKVMSDTEQIKNNSIALQAEYTKQKNYELWNNQSGSSHNSGNRKKQQQAQTLIDNHIETGNFWYEEINMPPNQDYQIYKQLEAKSKLVNNNNNVNKMSKDEQLKIKQDEARQQKLRKNQNQKINDLWSELRQQISQYSKVPDFSSKKAGLKTKKGDLPKKTDIQSKTPDLRPKKKQNQIQKIKNNIQIYRQKPNQNKNGIKATKNSKGADNVVETPLHQSKQKPLKSMSVALIRPDNTNNADNADNAEIADIADNSQRSKLKDWIKSNRQLANRRQKYAQQQQFRVWAQQNMQREAKRFKIQRQKQIRANIVQQRLGQIQQIKVKKQELSRVKLKIKNKNKQQINFYEDPFEQIKVQKQIQHSGQKQKDKDRYKIKVNRKKQKDIAASQGEHKNKRLRPKKAYSDVNLRIKINQDKLDIKKSQSVSLLKSDGSSVGSYANFLEHKKNSQIPYQDKDKLLRRRIFNNRVRELPVNVDQQKKKQLLIQIDKAMNPLKYQLMSRKGLTDNQIYDNSKQSDVNVDARQQRKLGNKYLKQLRQNNKDSQFRLNRSIQSTLPHVRHNKYNNALGVDNKIMDYEKDLQQLQHKIKKQKEGVQQIIEVVQQQNKKQKTKQIIVKQQNTKQNNRKKRQKSVDVDLQYMKQLGI